MKANIIVVTAAAAVGLAGLLVSTSAQARINWATCVKVYAQCEAGDQAACNSRTYQVCERQWGGAPFIVEQDRKD